MYFLNDFAEFGIGKTILNHPGKAMAVAAGLGGGIGLGASYLNKKDKRTFRQRATDVGKAVIPFAALTGLAHSKGTDRLLSKAQNKYGTKGLVAAGLGGAGLIIGGSVAAQKMRKKHAENTRKTRKKGQRLKDVNVNMLGLKYKDYGANMVY